MEGILKLKSQLIYGLDRLIEQTLHSVFLKHLITCPILAQTLD